MNTILKNSEKEEIQISLFNQIIIQGELDGKD